MDTEHQAAMADPTEATIQAAENPAAVRALITAERQAAREAREEAKARVGEATAENDELRLTIDRLKAAGAAGLDLGLADRLTGTTREELVADAARFAAQVAQQRGITETTSTGTEPGEDQGPGQEVNPLTGRLPNGSVPFIDSAETSEETSGPQLAAKLFGRELPEPGPVENTPATADEFGGGARATAPTPVDPVRAMNNLILGLSGRYVDPYPAYDYRGGGLAR